MQAIIVLEDRLREIEKSIAMYYRIAFPQSVLKEMGPCIIFYRNETASGGAIISRLEEERNEIQILIKSKSTK